jgi:antitoxin VapB
METAKLFMNGRSQAVRLPKEFRFDGEEVYIRKVGEAVILIPYHAPWSTLIDSLGEFSTDYMAERRQPPTQEREDPFP